MLHVRSFIPSGINAFARLKPNKMNVVKIFSSSRKGYIERLPEKVTSMHIFAPQIMDQK